MTKILIVGGGIAGLAAAYYTQQKFPDPVSITLLEAGPRWGGKITTDRAEIPDSDGQFVV